MNFQLAFQFFIALLGIINPFGKVPLWIKLSKDDNNEIRWHLALRVVGTSFAVLIVTLILGKEILSIFGIDIASFRIGGGVVILLIGISMLDGTAANIKFDDEKDDDTMTRVKKKFQKIAVPMAVPLIAGPGSISTTLLYAHRANDFMDFFFLSVILAVVLAMVYFVLFFSHKIRKVVGDTALEVQTRIFGLILTAIAAQLIVEGLGAVFPEWLNSASPLMDDLTNFSK